MEALKTAGLAIGIFSCIMGGISICTETDSHKKSDGKITLLCGIFTVSSILTSLSDCKCNCACTSS